MASIRTARVLAAVADFADFADEAPSGSVVGRQPLADPGRGR